MSEVKFNMELTPKLQRKASLSLTTRLNKKRHSASPQQNHVKRSSTESNAVNIREINSISESLQRSPSAISICSDGGIECTPPPKKVAMNLDESLDFSPKMFDTSFSPTCLLSQTLAINSPEVGWKWNRHSEIGSDPSCGIEINSIRTPDSAYAADSSFASAGSSSTDVAGNVHLIGNCQQRNASGARREDRRRIMEQQLRRVEHTRAEEMLKRRCAKLQEQLKSAGTQKLRTGSSSKEGAKKKNVYLMSESTTHSTNTVVKFQAPENPKKSELLSDFFDDSEMDCFLLEVTQEIESKIVAKTQPAFVNCVTGTQNSSTYSECSSIPHASSAPAAASTPPPVKNASSLTNMSSASSENKDKPSSFYMKFLEDDCPDEWFVSLDEVILQATENKKPRNSLQRYKSMPAETAGTSQTILNNKDGNDNCVVSKKTISEESTASSSTFSKMKRHSSTHTLSPAGSHYRSRRQL